MRLEKVCSDLQQGRVTTCSPVVLAWQPLDGRTTAEAREEGRQETWGSPRRLQLEAAVGFPSETEMDSAVYLRGGEDEAEVMSFMPDETLLSASCCVPGRDGAADVLALASKLRSLCLNTSLGLKDRWEISDLASCSGFQTAAGSAAFPPHKYKHSLTLPGVRSYSRWLSAQRERSWFLSFGFCFPPHSKTQRVAINGVTLPAFPQPFFLISAKVHK